MPQMNGFELLEELEKYLEKPCIIFTTGFAEYAIESIKATNYGHK
jgi:DNA-binding LytR/AlgR family response regulator